MHTKSTAPQQSLDFIMRDASMLPTFTDPVGAYPVRFDTLGQKISYWREQYRNAVRFDQLTEVKKCLWHLEILANYWNRFVPVLGEAMGVTDTESQPAVASGKAHLDGTIFYIDKYGEPAICPSIGTPGADAGEYARLVKPVQTRLRQIENARSTTMDSTAERRYRGRIGSLMKDSEYQKWNRAAAERVAPLEFPDPPPGMPFDWHWSQNFTRFAFAKVRAMLSRIGYKLTIYQNPQGRKGEWDWQFTTVRGGSQDVILFSGVANYIWMFDLQQNGMQQPFFMQNPAQRGTPKQGIPLSMGDVAAWNRNGTFEPKEAQAYKASWQAVYQWIQKSV